MCKPDSVAVCRYMHCMVISEQLEAHPEGHYTDHRLMSSSRRAINAENRRCASFEADSDAVSQIPPVSEHGSGNYPAQVLV